jgi:hypothetical protein
MFIKCRILLSSENVLLPLSNSLSDQFKCSQIPLACLRTYGSFRKYYRPIITSPMGLIPSPPCPPRMVSRKNQEVLKFSKSTTPLPHMLSPTCTKIFIYTE